jgi:hypothetical protein
MCGRVWRWLCRWFKSSNLAPENQGRKSAPVTIRQFNRATLPPRRDSTPAKIKRNRSRRPGVSLAHFNELGRILEFERRNGVESRQPWQ